MNATVATSQWHDIWLHGTIKVLPNVVVVVVAIVYHSNQKNAIGKQWKQSICANNDILLDAHRMRSFHQMLVPVAQWLFAYVLYTYICRYIYVFAFAHLSNRWLPYGSLSHQPIRRNILWSESEFNKHINQSEFCLSNEKCAPDTQTHEQTNEPWRTNRPLSDKRTKTVQPNKCFHRFVLYSSRSGFPICTFFVHNKFISCGSRVNSSAAQIANVIESMFSMPRAFKVSTSTDSKCTLNSIHIHYDYYKHRAHMLRIHWSCYSTLTPSLDMWWWM